MEQFDLFGGIPASEIPNIIVIGSEGLEHYVRQDEAGNLWFEVPSNVVSEDEIMEDAVRRAQELE